MKSFRNLILAATAIGIAVSAMARLVPIVPLPPTVTISATMKGKDAVISWSGPVSVKAVVHHGPGPDMNKESEIAVASGAKQAVLPDVKKNGEYFSLAFTDGSYLHLACPHPNPHYTTPTLKKIAVNCDPARPDRVGLLKVIY